MLGGDHKDGGLIHIAVCSHHQWQGPKGIIITPLRDPRKMWISWVKRMESPERTINACIPLFGEHNRWDRLSTVDHLDPTHVCCLPVCRGEQVVPLDLFEEQWRQLEILDKRYDIFYVPVDLPITQERIKELSVVLDRPLSFDGNNKIGHVDGPIETDHPGPDWEYIYSLPMVSKYYSKDTNDNIKGIQERITNTPQEL